MNKPPRAAIFFYDEDAQEFKVCNVRRAEVQALIDRGTVMPVLLEGHDDSNTAITDEDARRLGGMLMLMQGNTNPDLRQRFKITTARPMNWEAPTHPERE